MSDMPPALAPGHVGLNVTSVERSRDFYRDVVGLTVRGEALDGPRRYAFLGTADATLVTLWEQTDTPFATDRAGLHHLAFAVASIEEVEALERRVRAAGAELVYETIVPHREHASDGGLYFRDPDGIRLEVYALEGADAHGEAPTPGAPTCGFF